MLRAVLLLCALAPPALTLPQLDVGLFSQLYYPRLSYFTYMHPGYQHRPKPVNMKLGGAALALHAERAPLNKQVERIGQDNDAFAPDAFAPVYPSLVRVRRSAFDSGSAEEGNDAALARAQEAMKDPDWVPDMRPRQHTESATERDDLIEPVSISAPL